MKTSPRTTRSSALRPLPSLLCLLASVLCLLAPGSLRADDVYWTSASGTWFTPNGWLDDTPPTGVPRNAPDAADHVGILRGTVDIGSGISVTTATASIGHWAGEIATVNLDGYWQNTADTVIGSTHDGLLNIATSGTLASGRGVLGLDAGASGTAIVSGYWNSSDALYIGFQGNGSLMIETGGTVISGGFYAGEYDGAEAKITVAGLMQSTQAVVIGQRGTATMDIISGGTMSANGTINLGNTANGVGAINVENGGYLYSSAQIRMGIVAGGTGILNIESGATVRAATGVYASLANGYGVINIATGGTLTIDTNTLYIGNGGTANANSYGEVNIDGFFQSGSANATSPLGTYYFPVGYAGTGVLNIGVTGTVFSGQLDIGREATASGTVTIAGYYKSGNGTSLVGSLGQGFLDVKSTGYMNFGGNTSLTIANSGAGTGILNVSGTIKDVSTFYIGNTTTGESTLNIAQGGYLSTTANSWFNRNLPTGDYAGQINGLSTANVDGTWITGRYINANYGQYYLYVGPTGIVRASGVDGTTVTGFRLGGAVKSSGTVIVAGLIEITDGPVSVGYAQAAATGTVGDSAKATMHILQTGTVIAGAGESSLGTLGFGSSGNPDVESAVGIAYVDGVWLNTGNTDLSIGRSGDGTLYLANTGTITNRHAYIGRYFNTRHANGIADISGVWDIRGNMEIGGAGNGLVILNNTAIVTANNNLTVGGANVNGIGRLEIASGASLTAGSDYSQNARSTLSVELATTRAPDALFPELTAPLISVGGKATLSGTLHAYGNAIANIPEFEWVNNQARASTLTGIPVLRAIGGITGDFDSVEIDGLTIPPGLPDFIRGGGLKINEGGPVDTRYDIGYGLAWKAGVNSAHGTFTLDDGKTFIVDIQLADRPGITFDTGWDGQSFVKKGPGTLVFAVQNTYTGATTVDEGILRLAGPVNITLNDLVINSGTIDFGSLNAIGYDPAVAGANPYLSAGDYRTIHADSLTGDGTYRMSYDLSTGAGDKLIIGGDATGAHQLNVTLKNSGGMPTGAEPVPELVVIGGVDQTTLTTDVIIDGVSNGASFDRGAFHYEVVTDTVAGTLKILPVSMGAMYRDPINGVLGAPLSLLWFDQQDNLTRRFGELRTPRETGSGFDLWARGHAATATIGGGSTNMRLADIDLKGAEIGADHTWLLDDERVTIGLYAGIGNASQDYAPIAAAGAATRDSDLLGFGLYAAWLADSGWFANATLSSVTYDNTLDAANLAGDHTTADYTDRAFGASVEIGRRVQLGSGYFAEPSLQGTLARLSSASYTTSGLKAGDIEPSYVFSVRGSAATLTRARAAIRAGRAWEINHLGWLELAARAAFVRETSSGGELTIGPEKWSPNLDGTRYEAGLGLHWQPFNRGQLYFDYEYSAGDNYEKPWSISLGLRLSL